MPRTSGEVEERAAKHDMKNGSRNSRHRDPAKVYQNLYSHTSSLLAMFPTSSKCTENQNATKTSHLQPSGSFYMNS